MEYRKHRHIGLRAAVLAAGLAIAGGASAEPLAGLGVQYKFISPMSLVNLNGCISHNVYAVCPGGPDQSTNTPMHFQAPLDLPEGAKVQNIRVWYRDTSSIGGVSFGVMTNKLTLSSPYTFSGNQLVATGIGFNSGVATTYANPQIATLTPTSDFTFNSWEMSGGVPVHKEYVIDVVYPANNYLVMFQGALIAYQRQIAPAPATASFTDIPTSHPFFNEVEQLKKSGITLGCGGSEFCPDSPVTRGQMAAFLSRALGLQWDPGVL